MGGPDWDDLGLRLSYRHMKSLTRSFQISGKIGGRGMEVRPEHTMVSAYLTDKYVHVAACVRLSFGNSRSLSEYGYEYTSVDCV